MQIHLSTLVADWVRSFPGLGQSCSNTVLNVLGGSPKGSFKALKMSLCDHPRCPNFPLGHPHKGLFKKPWGRTLATGPGRLGGRRGARARGNGTEVAHDLVGGLLGRCPLDRSTELPACACWACWLATIFGFMLLSIICCI